MVFCDRLCTASSFEYLIPHFEGESSSLLPKHESHYHRFKIYYVLSARFWQKASLQSYCFNFVATVTSRLLRTIILCSIHSNIFNEIISISHIAEDTIWISCFNIIYFTVHGVLDSSYISPNIVDFPLSMLHHFSRRLHIQIIHMLKMPLLKK